MSRLATISRKKNQMFSVERFYLSIAMAVMSERREKAKGDRGAAMVEYGLLIAFIAVIALVAVKVLGTKVSTLFNGISF